MDYEKAYKDALETARKINSGEGVAAPPDWTVYEVIFPELKESEDERIRKSLINLFKIENFNGYTTLNGIDVDDVIAWLEKQKTSEEAIKYLKENHSPSEISDFQAAMNIAVAKAYDRGRRDAEKQGEQRSKLVDFDYNAKDSDLQEVTYFIPNGFHAEIDGNKVVIKQGEKKPAVDFRAEDWCVSKVDGKIHNIYNSEVGPKFKEGQWITIKE